jgi:hypothetical protein
MAIETDLNNDILKTMRTIENKYPELLKYLEEMPVTIPNNNNPEINSKNLKEYSDSLNSLLNNYASNENHKKIISQFKIFKNEIT